MKNFKKALAMLLSFAMLVTSLLVYAPSETYAADKITLRSGAAAPSTIYAGHSYNLKVAKRSVRFLSRNKKVATINSQTGKLTAKAPGSVTIVAKDSKTHKHVASKTFKVLQRAKSVSVNESEVYIPKVNGTFKIVATKNPTTSTDAISFSSSDKTIATVNPTSGLVKGIKKGVAIITVYSKPSKATVNKSKVNKTTQVVVHVGEHKPYDPNSCVIKVVKDSSITDFEEMDDLSEIYQGDTDNTAYFKFLDADCKETNDVGHYDVISSDPEVLYLASDTVDANSKSIKVLGLKEGSASIIVKNVDNDDVVGVYELKVKATRKPSTISIDNPVIKISNSTEDEKGDTATVLVSLIDQYKEIYSVSAKPEVTVEAFPTVTSAEEAIKMITTADGRVTVNGKGMMVGTYVFNISCKDYNLAAAKLTVTVEQPKAKASATYTFSIDKKSVDAAINSAADTAKVISTTVKELKADVFNREIVDYAISVVDSSNTPAVINTKDGSVDVCQGRSIRINYQDEAGYWYKLAPGKYTVKAYGNIDGTVITKTETFTVTDSQKQLTAQAISNASVNSTNADSIFGQACVFTYNSKTYTNSILPEYSSAEPIKLVGSVVSDMSGKKLLKSTYACIPVAEDVTVAMYIEVTGVVTITSNAKPKLIDLEVSDAVYLVFDGDISNLKIIASEILIEVSSYKIEIKEIEIAPGGVNTRIKLTNYIPINDTYKITILNDKVDSTPFEKTII